jgi:hypothetical protein
MFLSRLAAKCSAVINREFSLNIFMFINILLSIVSTRVSASFTRETQVEILHREETKRGRVEGGRHVKGDVANEEDSSERGQEEKK